jgi:hypothetical protein
MENTAVESKSQRGGKRSGSGRKPSTLKGIARKLPKESAELLLAEIKANQKWVQLASSDDERIVLETLKYLTDRALGKAPQSLDLNHKGEVISRVVSDL